MASVFISLPVTDLERTKAFYTALGCTINPEMSDENGVCVVWDDNIFFMMITREFFATFTEKPIVDPRISLQTSASFALDSREEVDAALARGLAAGGTEPQPAQDYGFMYSRDLDDPDGNSLGFLYMVPGGAEQEADASAATA
ncbi:MULTISPECIES: VOC family protein [unclassified Microbacterium]|uniref:VOC family protein n=1 Tax=unclassified Microbacterium TaxID=2609290 RepID=UPI001AC1DCDD|nr:MULTISPECIES: VOC family protein [unclassified Microbacterium]MBN9157026.1 glyoxalase [Microbacterium sp.]MBS1897952.1 glyoxalase [Actinomycetota bacterium]MBS1899898.1 glyoxalase [Actinomycetota bacterium]